MILLSHKLYTVVEEYLDLIDSFSLLVTSQESQAGLMYFKGRSECAPSWLFTACCSALGDGISGQEVSWLTPRCLLRHGVL